MLYLFTSWNRFVNDLRAVSNFEYQIIPAQDLGKSFLTFLSGLSILFVILQKVFICKTHSAFTINTPSNKRPLKKLKKLLNALGLYSEYYVRNLQGCNSFILLWPPRNFWLPISVTIMLLDPQSEYVKKQIFWNYCFV